MFEAVKDSSVVNSLVLEQSAKVGYTLTTLFRAFSASLAVCQKIFNP